MLLNVYVIVVVDSFNHLEEKMLEFEGRVAIFLAALMLVCSMPFINGDIKDPAQPMQQEKKQIKLTAAQYIDRMGVWSKPNKIREATAESR